MPKAIATRNLVVLVGWVVLSAALLAALYYRTMATFMPRWADEAPYQHCVLVPFIVAGLVWFHRGRLRELRRQPSYLGLLILTAGLLVAFIGYLTGARSLVGFSFPVVIIGLVGASCGMQYLRVLVFPLALFFFAVPFPRHVLGMVAMPMQLVSSALTAYVVRAFGIPIVHDGVNIALPSFQFVVAEKCSGMNSMMALFLAGGVIMELVGLVPWQKLVMYVLTPALVITANVVRLVSVVLLGELIGPDFALNSMIHGGSDAVIYLAAFALLWGASHFLKQWSESLSHPDKPSEQPQTDAV